MQITKEFPATISPNSAAPPYKNNGRLIINEDSEVDQQIIAAMKERGLNLRGSQEGFQYSIATDAISTAIWISAKTAKLCNSILNRLRTNIQRKAQKANS